MVPMNINTRLVTVKYFTSRNGLDLSSITRARFRGLSRCKFRRRPARTGSNVTGSGRFGATSIGCFIRAADGRRFRGPCRGLVKVARRVPNINRPHFGRTAAVRLASGLPENDFTAARGTLRRLGRTGGHPPVGLDPFFLSGSHPLANKRLNFRRKRPIRKIKRIASPWPRNRSRRKHRREKREYRTAPVCATMYFH